MDCASPERLTAGQNIASDLGGTKIIKVDETTVVKTGKYVRLQEAYTMQYIKEHTDVPVPSVRGAWRDSQSDCSYIVMDYVPGTTLEEAWDKLDPNEKRSILASLRDILGQLRGLKGKFIGSINGSHCEDVIFSGSNSPHGPYESEADFTHGMIAALNEQQQSMWVDLVCQMMKTTLQGHEIVLTHGDFLPRNIMVHEGKVAAIIDWEMAGWYPEYWEYCKIMYRPAWRAGWVKEKWEESITTPYHAELAVMLHMERMIW